MAGDHKCPVCQSTFTRPQHVARHMRSHTGDRPYKCQHCGDQFARSDLLSRHVNKCHASEKPPTTTAPNRRKGTAAASRATTSKQACDQCVQSSLPCDGANPCTKCVQRKCRCTYVKFHRQTAPQGPGHPSVTTQPAPTIPGRTAGMSGRPMDDFVLGPPPANAPFNFPSVYPSEYLTQPNAAAGGLYSQPQYARESPAPSLAMSGSSRDSIDANPELIARYRAQAELLSRAGVLPNGSILPGSTHPGQTDAALPGIYDTAQNQAPVNSNVHYGRYALPGWPTQQQYQVEEKPSHGTYDHGASGSTGQSFRDGPDGMAAHAPHAYAATVPGASGLEGYAGQLTYRQGHGQRDELGSSGTEGSDGGYSNSMPSSRNSSQVHLPLDAHAPPEPRYDYHHGQDGAGEGGFSSAFGLMSLDDPNVLAGLSSDSAPFFSALGGGAQGLSLATPTQDLLAALKSNGAREDSKEVRDFWKMYLKTPLSGPGSSSNILAMATPTGAGAMLGAPAARPDAPRRHSRVASLPSMKTPPLLADPAFAGGYAARWDGERAREGPGDSALRTTLQGVGAGHAHGGEDLKSYEQAVLARKAPMTLNLVPKRKNTGPNAAPPGPGQRAPSLASVSGFNTAGRSNSSGGGGQFAQPGAPASQSQGQGQQGAVGGMKAVQDLLNRPDSALSLASDGGPAPTGSLPPMQSLFNADGSVSASAAQAYGLAPEAPRAASDAGDSDAGGYRPSFKRLASQTLGPEHSKRALLGPAGWDDPDADELELEEEEESEEDGEPGALEGKRYGSAGARRRPMVGLADRRRRMSAPEGQAVGGAQGPAVAIDAALKLDAGAGYP